MSMQVMNAYIENLGASKDWGFYDVYGLDADLLAMVPRPVAAVMLLYPITKQVSSNTYNQSSTIHHQHPPPNTTTTTILTSLPLPYHPFSSLIRSVALFASPSSANTQFCR